jgi:hypothetical protein
MFHLLEDLVTISKCFVVNEPILLDLFFDTDATTRHDLSTRYDIWMCRSRERIYERFWGGFL